MDPDAFRHVLGHVPTSVAVITGIDGEGAPAGLAVGSLCSVSLDPPLVLFCPGRGSTSWPRIEHAGGFAANVLGEGQAGLSRRFALPGGEKFAGLPWTPSPMTGSPLLEGVLAWLDCEVESVTDAGDHRIVLGRVRALQVATDDRPLVVFRRGYLHEPAA